MEQTLPRESYLADEHFAREKERIFCREWLCVAREEDLAAPGDYLALDLLGESALLLRGRDGALHAHYNVCRHRGCQLAQPAGRGSFPGVIRCPYHAWTYNLDGSLRGAPHLGDELPRAELALFPLGVDVWGGFVFVHLTPAEARPLREQLGAAVGRLARYPLRDLRAARRITYEVRANWKVLCENYNECYHCAGVHPELCRVVPSFRQGGGAGLDWENGVPHAEGMYTFTWDGTTSRAPFPGLGEAELNRHKGELIYPNLFLSASRDHVAAFTLWPHGPGHTTVTCDFLFAQEEIARPEFDPSDAVDFWDLINRQDWAVCEATQRGMAARVFRHGFYAPMEDWSLDIRRYVEQRLG